MWLAILLLIASIGVLIAFYHRYGVHESASMTVGASHGATRLDDADVDTERPVTAPVAVHRAQSRPFELPTFDATGADYDADKSRVYATVTQMRDPRNWTQQPSDPA